MLFYGKYTFRSTNAGPKKYLTSSTSQGMTYPTVSADEASETERFIVYRDDEDRLVVQMGDLFYLSAVEVVGWVVGATEPDRAYPMKIVEESNGAVSIEIYLSDADQWAQIRYGFQDLQASYLVFPVPGGRQLADSTRTFQTFTRQTVTPPLPAIRSSKDARGLDFRNVDLRGADLSGIDCSGADFTGARLDGADFSNASLARATFLGATFDKTVVAGAVLDGAVFGAASTVTDLSTVDWGRAVSARGADFTRCVAVGGRIGSQDPSRRADFTNAIFDGADFTGADLANAKLAGASLLSAVFVGANLAQVDFTAAQLGGVDKTAAADLGYAYMPNVSFDKANLFGVSFAFSTLFGASTSLNDTSTLEQADFSGAYLEGVDLTSAILRGSKFNDACLANVDLTRADLSPTLAGSVTSSLAGACLQGAVFTGSNLRNADLTGATVAFARGSLEVRYCDPATGGPFPPPPDFEPLNYSPTAGLDFTTMTAETVCPNGLTLSANRARGNDLRRMLTIKDPATRWTPLGCSPTEAERTRDSPIVIETPNVVLRALSPRHFRDLRRLADDPDVRRHLFCGQRLSDRRLKAMIHFERVRLKRSGLGLLSAYRKADKAFIAVCGLAESVAGGVEINVAVMPALRGDPVVKEMYRAVLEYGFASRRLERILGLVEPGNVAAEKFAAKMGFRFRRDVLVQGWIPFKVYEITVGSPINV